MSAMRRSGHQSPPRQHCRVSFECDQPKERLPTAIPSTLTPTKEVLSSSAPPALFSFPFACDEQPMGRTKSWTSNSRLQESEKGLPQRSNSATSAFSQRKNRNPTSTGATKSIAPNRRHSSEDGLSTRSSSQVDEYMIPSRCRMVFHMKDEVAKGRDCSDKNTLPEKRGGPRPQQQPRQKNKGSGQAKCVKSVSFLDPEPCRDEEDPFTPTQSRSRASPPVSSFTLPLSSADVPAITLTPPLKSVVGFTSAISSSSATSPRQDKDQVQISHHRETLTSDSETFRPRSLEEETRGNIHPRTTALDSPSSTCHSAALPRSSSSESGSNGGSNRHDSIVSAAAPSFNSTPTQYHPRNSSAPAAFASPSSSTTRQGRDRTRLDSSASSIQSTGSKSGSRFSRLWKSVAQRYTHSPPHSHHLQHGGRLGQDSDLEPLCPC